LGVCDSRGALVGGGGLLEVVVGGNDAGSDHGLEPGLVFEVWVVRVVLGQGRVSEGRADGGIFMAVPDEEFRVAGDWAGGDEEGSAVDQGENAIGRLAWGWFVCEHGDGKASTADVREVEGGDRAAVNPCLGWEDP
jgi:hypothetical protein